MHVCLLFEDTLETWMLFATWGRCKNSASTCVHVSCAHIRLYVWCMCVLQIVHVSTCVYMSGACVSCKLCMCLHIWCMCLTCVCADKVAIVTVNYRNCLLHDVCAAMSLCGVAQATNVRICIYLVLHRLVEGFHGRS